MRLIISLALILPALSLAASQVLHTQSRWIVDSNGQRVKLRCVNWAGHMEVGIPEGLQHQSIDKISSFVASAGFNCVRLTYSIDMALSPNTLVSDSFNAAAGPTGVPLATLQSLYQNVTANNPSLSSATTLSAFGAVISSLGSKGIMVILDNHVSKAQWCCNLTDGNGWWSQASGYNSMNSRYFDANNWLAGLTAMANFSKQYPNIVGMSLRNEMRAFLLQDFNNHADWKNFVTQGANAVHNAHPDLLIMIGGVDSATNFSFQRFQPFNISAWLGKVVWEYHVYSFTVGYITSNCNIFQAEMGAAAGYLLTQNMPYTGPLWLSEFGFGMTGGNNNGVNDQDYKYLTCLVSYLQSNDADWAIWALQGDYYVREGQPSYDEGYGVMNKDWSDFRNPNFKSLLGGIFNVTQGP
ncbi:glycosyl hydrolase family 5 protein/cellulase [Dissophora ornata]|nr:hypothetical protein BGZ58_005000 [Dissophora ornata]KAI8602269.1 glycosyl hydrolase family 5 protein/cellulase [Dissophora ornata]